MARRFGVQTNYLAVATDVALLSFDDPDASFSWSARVRARTFDLASRNVVLSKYASNLTYLFGTLTSSGVNCPSMFLIQNSGLSGRESTLSRPLLVDTPAVIGGEQNVSAATLAAWMNDQKAQDVTITSGVANSTGTWRIGSHPQTTGNPWQGDIQDVAMWTVLLSRAERVALAQGVSPLQIQRAHLVGYWPLMENGGSAMDFSGNGNTMVQSGTVPSAPDIPAPYRLQMWFPTEELIDNVVGTPPVNTVAPVVTGTPEVGQTLSTTTGTWTGNPAPTFTYQWQYNDGTWNNIAGATSQTWVIDVSGAVDVGDTIRCVVTGTNSSGNASANSNAVGPITAVSLTGHRAMASLA